MSTAPRHHETLEKLNWYLSHHQHAAWDRFSPEEQDQMVNEDLFAGRSVSILLASLIATGMILSLATLLTILVMS